MIKQIQIFFYLALAGYSLPLIGQNLPFESPTHVQAELVSSQSHAVPGKTLLIGLRLIHDEHWHTYWKTTATGYATSINWDLPEGYTASDIIWPAPKMYDFEGYIEYVYEDEIILPIEITIPENAQGDSITLKGTADWLMCEKLCIPGSAEVELVLPLKNTPATGHPKWEQDFEKIFNQSIPEAPQSIAFNAWRSGDEVILEIEGETLPENPYFYDEQTFIVPTLTQTAEIVSKNKVRLRFEVDSAGVGQVDRLVGVITADTAWPGEGERLALKVDTALTTKVPTPAEPLSAVALIPIIGLAFIGGLILNLMPCVFPVLGIKIMGFVGQAGESKAKVALHGLTFTLGVLLSFWLLAAVLLILRSSGQELGWGFQLQSAPFVFLLTIFLFLFALNLTGLFEVGQSAVGVGSQLTAKSGLTGSFFSGVLATVVATPCAAPFLAPALGAALALPPVKSIIVFTAIALGLALPYLVLSLFPSLIRYLPKPGAWMETFKQFMSFPLFATVAFLLWVLVGQLSESAGYSIYSLLYIFISIILVAFAAWIYGRWGAFHRKKGPRRIAILIAAIILVGAISFGYPSDPSPTSQSITWEKWEPNKAESLAADGKIVYVDFTARWCVTCQTNKAAVFSSNEVVDWINDNDVVLLKADWTNRDDQITQALRKWDRSAVPFNLVYSPNQSSPKPLPEILTPNIVLTALKEAQ